MKYKTLISPTRGVNYTVVDALRKFLERRKFSWNINEVKAYPRQYQYSNDYDGYIILEAESYPSLWTDSIVSRLYAAVPFHFTDEGRLSFGEYLSSDPDAESLPEYYSELPETKIISWLVGREEDSETITFSWDVTGQTQQDEQGLIVRILKEALLESRVVSFIDEQTHSGGETS